MKKIFYTLILLFFTTKVYAYNDQSYYIDMSLNPDGSLLVKEVLFLEGDYNGFTFEKRYASDNMKKFTGLKEDLEGSSDIYNATAIQVKKVGTTQKSNFTSIKDALITSIPNNSSGQNNTYQVFDAKYGRDIKVYNNNEGFYIEYLITDAIVLHNDIAELFFPVIDSNFRENINNAKITITLPNNDPSLLIWEHGQYNKEINYGNYKTISIDLKDVKKQTLIDIRLLFNKDLIPYSNKLSYINALDFIKDIEVKKDLEAKLNYETKQKELKELTNNLNTSSLVWTVVMFLLFIYIYKKEDKERSSIFKQQYHRTLPDTYNPAITAYLMHNKIISTKDFSNVILSLVEKKCFMLDKLPDIKEFIITRENYRLTKNKNFDLTSLSQSELQIVEWLIDDLGDRNSITLDEISKKAKEDTTFIIKYNKWVKKVTDESKEQQFFEKKSILPIVISFIVSTIGFFLSIIYISNEIITIYSFSNILIGIIFILYCLLLTKKTVKGIEHYTKWKAFKRFLLDFGRFNEKELPEIALWEKYLVYAAVFGIADKVEDTMKIKIKELGVDNVNFSYLHMASINHNFVSSLNNSFAATANTYSGSGSSSSFGGGSGFGGGGGRF